MTFTHCVITGQPLVTTVAVTVTDNGQPSVTPPVADHISFTAGTIAVSDAALTGGNIKIRP